LGSGILYKAYLISTGNEILNAEYADTNSVFLTRQLNDLGVSIVGKCTVADEPQSLRQAFRLALASADMVISTGGLGPTFDDLNRQVICELLGIKLEKREEELEKIQAFFAARRISMPPINERQAFFPEGAEALANHNGMAAGIYLRHEGKLVVMLPGPPREMEPMYIQELEPRLKRDFHLEKRPRPALTIKTIGLSESQVEEKLSDLIKKYQDLFYVSLLAKGSEIHLELKYKYELTAEDVFAPIVKEVKERLPGRVFGFNQDTLVSRCMELLLEQQKTLTVAESCTGGLLSKMLTDLPGSSQFFWGSVCTYSNTAKVQLLGVKEETLKSYGAVSQETAREMAQGMLKVSGSDISLAITGIAGPGGATEKKQVGLVYIALADRQGFVVKENHFPGARQEVRLRAAKTALDLLRRRLEKFI